MPKPKRSEKAETAPAGENRHGQVRRLYDILTLLENHPRGLTPKQINGYINPEDIDHKKKRTTYRDLEVLESMFPLEEVENDAAEDAAKLWRLKKDMKTRDSVVLSPREALALYFARQVLVPLRNTPFVMDLELLFNKIDAKLGARNREMLEQLKNEIHFEPGPAWGLGLVANVLDTVQDALAKEKYIKCTYKSASSQTTEQRTLGPQFTYYAKGALYLLALDTKDNKVKAFGLARMSDVEMLADCFEGEKIDPEKYFANSMGLFRGNGEPENVSVLFAPQISPYISERSWHSSQQVVKHQGGSVELKLNVVVSVELVNWILGHGPYATVLAPAHLVDKVVTAASAMVENYKKAVKKAG